MKLNQIATSIGVQTEESLSKLAVAEFMSNFPLANYLEFYSIRGNADSPRKVDSTMTAGANRTIGTDYSAKSNTPGFGSVVLKIYGDKVKTDIAYERRGIDIGSQRARDVANFSRSLGRYFMYSLINDELSATKFSGLKEQATALSQKSVYSTVNGGELPAGNDNTAFKAQMKFMEWLDAQLESISGGAQVIIANGAFKARLESVGRGFISTSNVADIYGQNQTVTSYKGIPILNAGYAANNSGLVIPSNETEGESSDCTSVYLARFGEEQDVTVATNVGIMTKDLGLSGTEYTTMVEFDVDLAVLNSKSFKRLSGIRLT